MYIKHISNHPQRNLYPSLLSRSNCTEDIFVPVGMHMFGFSIQFFEVHIPVLNFGILIMESGGAGFLCLKLSSRQFG